MCQTMSDGTGDDFYGDLMTQDALMVLANGAVMDRAVVTSALSQSPRWSRYAGWRLALYQHTAVTG